MGEGKRNYTRDVDVRMKYEVKKVGLILRVVLLNPLCYSCIGYSVTLSAGPVCLSVRLLSP